MAVPLNARKQWKRAANQWICGKGSMAARSFDGPVLESKCLAYTGPTKKQ
jgi:hypothetical protein